MRKILLILIGLSVALMAELTRDATTGIVRDSATGLMWQDDMMGIATTWQGALDGCKSLKLGLYDDWRLPSLNELKAIKSSHERRIFKFQLLLFLELYY